MAEPAARESCALRFRASASAGEVGALLLRPERARWLLVLAHGAGADMHHAFMEGAARALADEGIATLRYQFPYTEKGKRRPDPRPLLLATVRAALAAAAEVADGLPILAGGKSMGGRMTSLAAAEEALPGVRGIVFFGFPLHPAGKQDAAAERAAHLRQVGVPMLFLQGSRDRLADLELLRPIHAKLGAGAALHVVEDADHGFHVPKRTGRSDADVLVELARATRRWTEEGPLSS